MTGYLVTPLDAVDELEIRADATPVARKRIVADDPYLSGHYPDRTIYPGVFIVESLLQAARRYVRVVDGPDGTALVEIVSARFLAPLFLGDVLTIALSVTRDAGGLYTVDGRCTRSDGTPAARVILRCASHREQIPADPALLRAPEGYGSANPLRVPLDGLLPHRPPILLVDRVLVAQPQLAVTERTVRPDDPCYQRCPSSVDIARSAYPDTLVLESFAQGGAVLFMLDREPGGTLAFGAVRQVRVHAPVYPGETMRHRVVVEHRGANNSIVSGTTWVGDRLCLSVDRAVAVVRTALRGEAAVPAVSGAPR